MALDISGLKSAIDAVIIDGMTLTDKEQKKLFYDAYFTTVTYYLNKGKNNDAAYITALKAQIKGLYYAGVSITDTDRNTLLSSMYTKALSYYTIVVAMNRKANGCAGYPDIDIDNTFSPRSINYDGYYLND